MSWKCNLVSRLPQDFDDDDMLFLRQLGIDHTYYSLPVADHTPEAVRTLVKRINDGGLKIRTIQSNRFTFNPYIVLGIGDRDGEIDRYCEFVEICAENGIRNIEQNLQPYFIYSSGQTCLTREAVTRATDVDIITNSVVPPFGKPAWINPDQEAREKLLEKLFYESRERGYSREEIWDNFAYFMERLTPVLEKTDFSISLHPADPPCEEAIGGVPQMIRRFEDYKTAIRIAGTSHLKVTFCCGCWLEGGERFGNILENMEELLKDGRIGMVHIRNITSPMPRFEETFIDNGYYDYYPVFRLLAKYDYKGFVNPDHHPVMVDGGKRRAPQSYAIGFMRAYAMRAAAEADGK